MRRQGFYLALAVVIAAPSVEAKTKPEEGLASWYGETGHLTASGERFDRQRLTAAHPSLPFGSLIEVTNIKNGRKVIVTVNDRGPHWKKRIIDLSPAAAAVLGMRKRGITLVEVRPAEFE
jgi:rare lipoprotein A